MDSRGPAAAGPTCTIVQNVTEHDTRATRGGGSGGVTVRVLHRSRAYSPFNNDYTRRKFIVAIKAATIKSYEIADTSNYRVADYRLKCWSNYCCATAVTSHTAVALKLRGGFIVIRDPRKRFSSQIVKKISHAKQQMIHVRFRQTDGVSDFNEISTNLLNNSS